MSTILSPSFDEASARATAEACGARYADDPHGPQAVFDAPAGGDRSAILQRGALALLSDWGIVAVSGAEAVKFLHAQTTHDIEHQPDDVMRVNGYCTPKGRLLVAGPLWREPALGSTPPADGLALRFAVSRPLAEPLRKRLAMFVLRAKAKVEDLSDAFAILGLSGEAAPAALRSLGIEPPEPMHVARAVLARHPAPLTAIGFDPVAQVGHRWWLVVPRDALATVWQALAAQLTPVSSDAWRLTEILAGEPRVLPATTEAFIPQTLNFELIDGVSFRKGCYPGQEIVARLHYRGKPKRRMFGARLAVGGVAPAPGSELHAAVAGETPGTVVGSVSAPEAVGAGAAIGVVVMSAPAPGGGSALLYEAPIDAAAAGGLLSAGELALEPVALPYALPA